jgi:hypothetical protein
LRTDIEPALGQNQQQQSAQSSNQPRQLTDPSWRIGWLVDRVAY